MTICPKCKSVLQEKRKEICANDGKSRSLLEWCERFLIVKMNICTTCDYWDYKIIL